MGKSKRYRKSRKKEEDEQEQEEKRLLLLKQQELNKKFKSKSVSDLDDKQERKAEKTRLHNIIKEFNHG